MAVKTFSVGEVLTASDTNTYLNNGGLVYITSQTIGTAVSSVTVTNCFSSTYDNYRVVISGGVGSTSTDLRAQLGPSSVANYNTSYYGALFYIGAITDTTVSVAAMNNTGQWQWLAFVTTASVASSFDLLSPNQARPTFIVGGQYTQTAGTGFMNAMHNVSSAFTDLKIYPNSGTLTGGTITVYGYRKA